MRVILLKDIPRIGKKHDVKDVADGYAANYLLPKNLAEPATSECLRRLAQEKQRKETGTKEKNAALAEALQALAGARVPLPAKASEKGHLFKGIRAQDIVEALRKERGVEVPPEAVLLESPIKEIGEHAVRVAAGEHSASFTLSVLPDGRS